MLWVFMNVLVVNVRPRIGLNLLKTFDVSSGGTFPNLNSIRPNKFRDGLLDRNISSDGQFRLMPKKPVGLFKF